MGSSLETILQRMKHCDLCPHQCGVDRISGEKGICGESGFPRIYQNFLHLGEEETIIPAFVVNFSGCNLKCLDCSERIHWTLPSLNTGSADHYAHALCNYWKRTGLPGSIEWIGGEPVINLHYVLSVSEILKHELENCPPIYLNTNVYFEPSLTDYMQGIIDGFVFDLKCSAQCAEKLVGFSDYHEVVTENIKSIYNTWSPEKLILRHLVIPGHIECCTKEILEWCYRNTPNLWFNLMTGFHGTNGEILSAESTASAQEYLDGSKLGKRMLNGCVYGGGG